MDHRVLTMAEEIEAIPCLWTQCIHVPIPPTFQERVEVLEEYFFGRISRGSYKPRVSKIYEHMRKVVEQRHGLTRKKKTCKKGSPAGDDVQQPEESERAVIVVTLNVRRKPCRGSLAMG